MDVQWKDWRDSASAVALGFLRSEDRGTSAAGHHERLTKDGLGLTDVDTLVNWAAPNVEPHEALLTWTLFEKHCSLHLDAVAALGHLPVEAPELSADGSCADPSDVQRKID